MIERPSPGADERSGCLPARLVVRELVSVYALRAVAMTAATPALVGALELMEMMPFVSARVIGSFAFSRRTVVPSRMSSPGAEGAWSVACFPSKYAVTAAWL